MSKRSQGTTEQQAESSAPIISPKLPRRGIFPAAKKASASSILMDPPQAVPSAVSNRDYRSIINSDALSASKDDKETGYDQALYYAFHAKFGLPLEQGPKGLLPRPKSVNGVRMWDLGDRNRELYLITLVVNKDKYMLTEEASCGDLDREVSDAVNNPAKVVERLRGVVFWYTMRKKPAGAKSGSVYQGNGSRRAEPAADKRGFVTKKEQQRLIANVGVFYAPKVVQDAGIDLVPDYLECADLRFFYPIEGTVLRLFKYHGVVNYSTVSYINCNYSRHLFCPDYKKIYEQLGGPSEADLFGNVDTSKYVYLFKIVHPATGQCSANAFKQCLIFEGVDMANVDSALGDRVWPLADQVKERHYTDLIQRSNSEAGSVILKPVKVKSLSDEESLELYKNSITARGDVSYMIGVPDAKSGKNDVVLKFISPQYLMSTTARGNTQNVLRNTIDLVALTSMAFVDYKQVNGKDVFERKPYVTDGQYVAEYMFGGQVMFRETYQVVGGAPGVVDVNPEFSWLPLTGIPVDFASAAGRDAEVMKQFFYGTTYNEKGAPDGKVNPEGYLDGMTKARPNDWFRYARNVMYNNVNKGRRAALITYMSILREALIKMHNAGMGRTAWGQGVYVEKTFKPSVFGSRELKYPQGSASDSGYALVPIYPHTTTLYEAEVYLDINATLSSYQKEKVARAKEEIQIENTLAARLAKGESKTQKRELKADVHAEESDLKHTVSQYHASTSISKEEYDLFVKNYSARMAQFESKVLDPSVNLPLLYIRWTITDAERAVGKAFRTNGEYKFAKRVLEYFLECPI